MLCILDIDTSDKARAAEQVCALIELAMPKARREIRGLPRLYASKLKYIRQSPKACAFRSPKDVHSRGGGDCKQLVLIRLAELRELEGENATPRVIWLNEKEGLQAHAQIRRVSTDLEDPSFELGMAPIN